MLDDSSMMFPETAHFSGRVVHVTFVNKDKRYDVDRLNLHNFENYIKTEVVTDPQSKQETFEL